MRKKRNYAQGTTVPVERSRREIEKLLRKHGANGFSYGWLDGAGRMEFMLKGLRIRINLPQLETRGRTDKQVEQAEKEQWRALLLIMKAKLESITSGISVFEEEFLAFVMLPDGQNIGDKIIPELPHLSKGDSRLSLKSGERE